jgi:hypothetical protein
MNADETEVYEFLRGYPGVFVSVTEISRRMGARRKFDQDRTWARPILRRMELDGLLDSNEVGEYRLKQKPSETTSFKKALSVPGLPLGDTTIISLDEVSDS